MLGTGFSGGQTYYGGITYRTDLYCASGQFFVNINVTRYLTIGDPNAGVYSCRQGGDYKKIEVPTNSMGYPEGVVNLPGGVPGNLYQYEDGGAGSCTNAIAVAANIIGPLTLSGLNIMFTPQITGITCNELFPTG